MSEWWWALRSQHTADGVGGPMASLLANGDAFGQIDCAEVEFVVFLFLGGRDDLLNDGHGLAERLVERIKACARHGEHDGFDGARVSGDPLLEKLDDLGGLEALASACVGVHDERFDFIGRGIRVRSDGFPRRARGWARARR